MNWRWAYRVARPDRIGHDAEWRHMLRGDTCDARIGGPGDDAGMKRIVVNDIETVRFDPALRAVEGGVLIFG